MTKYGLTPMIHQGLTGLLLLLLFAAPLLMRCVSGGEGYLVAATGIIAFASLLLPVTNAGGHADRPATAALRLTAVDVAFLLCLGYMSLNLHRPIDTGLCAELLTIAGLWGHCDDRPRDASAAGWRWAWCSPPSCKPWWH